MTGRDEQLEARLRARPLPGLSAEARQRLLADLALAPLNHAGPPTEAIMGQSRPIATRARRQTIWRTIVAHRYAAACVAAIICTAIAGAIIVAHRMPGDAGNGLALHQSGPPVAGDRLAGSSASSEIELQTSKLWNRPNPPVPSEPSAVISEEIEINLGTSHPSVTPKPEGSTSARKSGPPSASSQACVTRKLELEKLERAAAQSTSSTMLLTDTPPFGPIWTAEVIVVASFMDSAPAKPGRPGDFAEASLRFRVARILKGKLDKKIVTLQTPAPSGFGPAGKEWILMLSPEYMAGKYRYGAIYTVELEPQIRAILAKGASTVPRKLVPGVGVTEKK